MKHIYLFCLFFVLSQFVSAQIYTQKVDEKLQLLDKTEITTNILYDRVFPMAKLLMFNESAADTSQASHLFQAYSEIQRADYNNRWQPVEDIIANVEAQTNAIPIGVLNVDFEYLDKEAIADNLLDIQGPDSLLVDVANRPRSPYIKENALVVSPLVFDTESLTVNFITGSNYSLQAANVSIISLQADFDNGQGFQNIPLSGSKTVTFNSTGIYNIKFKITLSNNSIQYTYAKVRVNGKPRISIIADPTKSPGTIDFCTTIQDTIVEITADIGFQGYTEYRKYYGTGSFAVYKGGSSFDKPVIVLDGFDPFEGDEDGKNVIEIYEEFLEYDTGLNLGNDLTPQGYDIIPLNFEKRRADDFNIINGGTDYIERNAMVLVELIEGLNNSSCWATNKEIKIIGFSMGGLIGRYALRYMELNNIPHHTDLFISVDSPHKGAVVPMGLQQTADLADDLFGGSVEQILGVDKFDKILKTPAAKQMLKHHYLSGSESPAGAPGFHDRFYNTLDNMGWPQQSRNIAVVNGVSTGVPTNNPGEQYLDANGELLIFDGDISLHFSPDRGMNNEVAKFRFFMGFVFWDIVLWSRTHRVHTSNNTGSLENAPGGYFGAEDMVSKFLPSNSGYGENYFVANWFAEVSKSKFSFIPVKSALAYSGENPDLYEDFSARNLVCTGETPFDGYFTAQTGNQEHPSLNVNSADYIKNEINGIQPAPNVVPIPGNINGPDAFCSSATYTLNNPPANTTVNWSITPSGIASLVPSGNSVTVNKTGGGDATLKAFYGSCGSEVVFSKNITTVAKIVSIEAVFNDCYNGYASWHLTATPNFSGAGGWQWTVDDPASGSWYIDQPNAGSTWVDVNGGGGLTVTYESPCGGTSEPNGVTIWSSCSSFNATMYPNPATESTITIDIQQSQKQSTKISSTNTISRDEKYIKEVEIYNIYGNLMKKQTYENNQSQVQIDISNLPTGIYFVRVFDGIHREELRLAVKKR